jgi:spore coat protein SA
MNIAIISPGPFSVPPVRGSSVEHDIEEFSKALGPEHQVTIYTRTCPDYPQSTQAGNRNYVRFPYTGQIPYLKRVINDLRSRKADVILVENRPAFVLPLRRHFPITPIVLNMHSHVFAGKKLISPEKMKKVSATIDAMITNSQFLRQHFIGRHRIHPDKVHAVHLGVDTAAYQNQDASSFKQLRKQLGLRRRHRVLLFAGRLMQEKGVHRLIESFHRISRLDSRARLIIVGGTGYGSNRLNGYVKQLHELAKPLGDKVRFVNFVPTAEMPGWYQIADVVATPSLWAEPFCRVNLEAMASGKPVLTTPQGGIPEVVTEQEGVLLPQEKWVERVPEIWRSLWENQQIRKTLGSNGLQRAQQFTWQATAQGYLNVFAQAIAQKAKTIKTR